MHLLHVDVLVSNMDQSLKFYRDVLGFPVVEDSVVGGALVTFLSKGTATSMRLVLLKVAQARSAFGGMIELMQFLDPAPGSEVIRHGSREPPIPSMNSFTLLVQDVSQTLATLERQGIPAASERFMVELSQGKAWIAFVRDPDGNLVELAQPLP